LESTDEVSGWMNRGPSGPVKTEEIKMELFKAHQQWATRPDDERFQTLDEMAEACVAYKHQAVEATIPVQEIKVRAEGDDLRLIHRGATLSNWAMGQLCNRAGAPASYLRRLPAELAANCLNEGLQCADDDDREALLLSHKREGGGEILRAATSDRYGRIWNADICKRLQHLLADNPNWTNPQVRSWTTGETTDDAALYASDHDMFAFFVDESIRIADGGPDGDGLARGFFVWNSEVGASSFGIMAFLYKFVCGNHIVWGAENVCEMRVRHVGEANARAFGELEYELRKYADSSVSDLEAHIESARRYRLGANFDEALETLFMGSKKLRVRIPQRTLTAALETAQQQVDRYGDPLTLWGAVNGLTENSQQITHMDTRMNLERAAGRLMAMAA
jgi:hypothetical protein